MCPNPQDSCHNEQTPLDFNEGVEHHATKLISLDQLKTGLCGTVVKVTADNEDAERLKAMGLCMDREVMLVKPGDPLILRVVGTRIGISARLASTVQVVPCPDPLCNTDTDRHGNQ